MRKQLLTLFIASFFVLGSFKLIGKCNSSGSIEETTLDIAHEFLSEVARLDIGENDVTHVDFMNISGTVNHCWDCQNVYLYLVDDSRVSLSIKLDEDELSIDDVVGYNLIATSMANVTDAGTSVSNFLSRLVDKSVAYKSVYQRALGIVEEFGIVDGAETLFDDMLYTVSKDEDTIVLMWNKVVEGIPCSNECYWIGDSLQISVSAEIGVTFFGNT